MVKKIKTEADVSMVGSATTNDVTVPTISTSQATSAACLSAFIHSVQESIRQCAAASYFPTASLALPTLPSPPPLQSHPQTCPPPSTPLISDLLAPPQEEHSFLAQALNSLPVTSSLNNVTSHNAFPLDISLTNHSSLNLSSAPPLDSMSTGKSNWKFFPFFLVKVSFILLVIQMDLRRSSRWLPRSLEKPVRSLTLNNNNNNNNSNNH